MDKIRLALFASGSGSNVENIAKYFHGHSTISIDLVAVDNPEAYVITRAKNLSIPYFTFTKQEMLDTAFTDHFSKRNIDFIILAGFLLKIPQFFIEQFPDRIMNIHPALLPKFGGKGMYGDRVHKAVIENKEKKSGISIHLVNQNYDEGKIIFQKSIDVIAEDTPQSLASRIHELEYKYYPKVIEEYIQKLS